MSKGRLETKTRLSGGPRLVFRSLFPPSLLSRLGDRDRPLSIILKYFDCHKIVFNTLVNIVDVVSEAGSDVSENGDNSEKTDIDSELENRVSNYSPNTFINNTDELGMLLKIVKKKKN